MSLLVSEEEDGGISDAARPSEGEGNQAQKSSVAWTSSEAIMGSKAE